MLAPAYAPGKHETCAKSASADIRAVGILEVQPDDRVSRFQASAARITAPCVLFAQYNAAFLTAARAAEAAQIDGKLAIPNGLTQLALFASSATAAQWRLDLAASPWPGTSQRN